MARMLRTPPPTAAVAAAGIASSITSASPVSVAATPTQEPLPDCFSLSSKTNDDETRNSFKASSWEHKTCPASAKSIRTLNPIRAIVDPIMANVQSGKDRDDGKDHISLALGDPTAHGHMEPCSLALEAIVQAIQSPGHAASYVNACGTLEARTAIAQYHDCPNPDHVIVANGCSGALELALTALLDPDTILLVPQPGFPLYQVIAESHGAKVLHYRLDPQRQWQVDLDHLEEQILQSMMPTVPNGDDDAQEPLDGACRHSIRAMVVTNPSNPTGSVYSKQHLQDILFVCQRFGIPIVADEVYGDLVLDPVATPFWPMATLAQPYQVPVITASGLAKQFLLPGWRVGWIVFHDNCCGSLQAVMAGAKQLAQLILGASHVTQAVIPALLTPSTPVQQATLQKWKSNLLFTLAQQAQFLCQELASCPGLQVVAPQGAMYAMVRIHTASEDNMSTAPMRAPSTLPPPLEQSVATPLAPPPPATTIRADVEFCKYLLDEENVLVLPGTAFGAAESNLVRVVFCAPEPIMREAMCRMKRFCQRHFVSPPPPPDVFSSTIPREKRRMQ